MDNLLAVCAGVALLAAGLVAVGKLALMARSAMRTVSTWDRILQLVFVEFRPNGGSTLRDAVDRLEQASGSQEVRLVRVELDVQALRHAGEGE